MNKYFQLFSAKNFLCLLLLIVLLSSFSQLCDAQICDSDCADEALPYAGMSKAIYTKWDYSEWKLIENKEWGDGCSWWEKIYLTKPLSCIFSGFHAGLYSNGTDYVVAFEGTEPGTENKPGFSFDWVTDVLVALGEFSNQYYQANNIVREYKDKYGSNIVLTGHSLGGGLAAYAAMENNLQAFVFNPAPISSDMINVSNLTKPIKSYILENKNTSEILSFVTIGNLFTVKYGRSFSRDYGERITVDACDDTLNPISLHSIQNMFSSLSNGECSEHFKTSQFPTSTFPGGDTFYQYAVGFTPYAPGTFYVKREDSNAVDSFDFRFDGEGNKEFEYRPPNDKPYGTYLWWIKDHYSGVTTENYPIPYKIIQPGNLQYIFGYEGGEYVDNTPVSNCLPDFVAKRTWITKSQNGNDKYVFEAGEKAWINTKIANEGCEHSPRDIDVWYLLSNGEKEDDHDDWVKISEDKIAKDELERDEDKWEKNEFTVPIEPGKYNIVACADRVELSGNGHGLVEEEHKSNDCSTETVFTVLPEVSLTVYDFWRAHDPIYTTSGAGFNNFEARFKIHNNSGVSQLIEDMKIDIHESSGLYKTCWQQNSSTLLSSGETLDLEKQFCEIDKAGTYSLEAKLKTDGVWETYQTHPNFEVKERDIEVISFTHDKEPIYATHGSGIMNFSTRVQLKNDSSQQVTINKLYIAVLLPNGLTKFDCYKRETPVYLNPGQVYDSMTQECDIWDPNEYSLQLKLDLGGSLGLLPYQALQPFTVSDSGSISNVEAIYRLWNSRISSHYYENARGQAEVVDKYTDWEPGPIAFWAPKPGVIGSVPIYVAWHSDSDPTKSTHYFTKSQTQYESLISSSYWSESGTNFSAFATKRPGTVEVYVYNSATVNAARLWTTEAPVTNSSCPSGKSLKNYTHYCYEGIAWYAYLDPPEKPQALTLNAINVTENSATLKGSVVTMGSETKAYFDYGLNSAFNYTIPLGDIGSGENLAIPLGAMISGLGCGQEYYYRIRAINDGGTSLGSAVSFMTTECPPPPDEDNDGIPDASDNCRSTFNYDQANFDQDGSGDLCDEDDDNDGMPDAWEIKYGLDPKNAIDAQEDLDDDGTTNYDEYTNNSNPLNDGNFPWMLFMPIITD